MDKFTDGKNQILGPVDVLEDPRQRFVFEHNTCAMCESELEIRHEINLKEFKLKEEAHCPSCSMRVRSTSHLLH